MVFWYKTAHINLHINLSMSNITNFFNLTNDYASLSNRLNLKKSCMLIIMISHAHIAWVYFLIWSEHLLGLESLYVFYFNISVSWWHYKCVNEILRRDKLNTNEIIMPQYLFNTVCLRNKLLFTYCWYYFVWQGTSLIIRISAFFQTGNKITILENIF